MPPNGQVSWLDATASGLLTRLIEVAHFAVESAPESATAVWARYKTYGYTLASARWPSSNIPLCWESTPKLPESTWVRQAIETTWQAHSSLKFSGWDTKCKASTPGTIRIKVADSGPRTLGLGTMLSGVKNGVLLNFSFKNWGKDCKKSAGARRACIDQIAIHEFGHAIGLAHEQNRPDKPGECTEKVSGTHGDLELTPYDPESVMNYCNKTYLNAGKLSLRDQQSVAALYPITGSFPPIAFVDRVSGISRGQRSQ